MTILKIVMTFNGFGYVIAWIKLRSIQRLNQANLVFIDDGRVEQTHIEQSGFAFVRAVNWGGLCVNAICSRRQDVDLGTLLPARRDVLLRILEIAMALDSLSEEPSRIEWAAISRRYYADPALRNYGRFRDRNAKQIRMNWPKSRRQSAQLNSLHTALLEKRDRILKVVVRVLCAIGCIDSTGGHWFAIDRFNHAEFV